MRNAALLAAVMLAAGPVSTAFAAPFVWPAKWSADPPREAKRGGEYRISSLSDPKTFNPFTTSISGDPPAVMGTGTGLFLQDPVTDDFIPYMAEGEPEISNNGKRFVVDIRRGMQFSDGQEVTADDWVTTWRLHVDDKMTSNSRDSFYLAGKPITVKKLGTYKLQFDFPAASSKAYAIMGYTPWPDHIFGPAYREGGAEAVKKMWGLNAAPASVVTAGMWLIDAYRPGERIVYKKNPQWGEWNKDSAGGALPYLDRYSITVVKDVNASIAAYLAGQIDSVGVPNADKLAEIKRTIDAGQLKAVLLANVSPQASTLYLTFNWNKASDPFKQALFRSVKFRHAMSHLIDREAINQLVYGGLSTPQWNAVYPIFQKAWVPDSTPRYDFNLAAAQKLLSELGFKKKDAEGWLVDAKGRRLEFNLQTNAGNTQREQIARILADTAKKVGVKVNTQFIDFNVLTTYTGSTGNDRPFDAIISGFSGGDNIWPFGVNIITCEGRLHNWNRSGKCLNSQEALMEKLYFQGDQELNLARRRQVGAQLAKVNAELAPHLYFPTPNFHVTYNTRVGGELPRELMSGYNGSRLLALTYIK